MNLIIIFGLVISTCHSFSVINTTPSSCQRRASLVNTITSSNTKSSTRLNAKAVIPENETDEEMRARLKKKMRKNLYSDKGVAYAPWVTQQIDEDAILEDAIRREKEAKTAKKKTTTLDRGEIEFSEGMKWRMAGDQVDLAWVTGSEANNKGFIVEKRPSYGGDFQEVASYKEVAQLVSKGSAGGRYRYTDPSTASGSWLYRVKDCDGDAVENVIAQCFVEVETASESKTQTGIVAALVAVLVAAAAAGYALDPPM